MKYLLFALLIAALLWIISAVRANRRRHANAGSDRSGGGSADSGGNSFSGCHTDGGSCDGGDGGGD